MSKKKLYVYAFFAIVFMSVWLYFIPGVKEAVYSNAVESPEITIVDGIIGTGMSILFFKLYKKEKLKHEEYNYREQLDKLTNKSIKLTEFNNKAQPSQLTDIEELDCLNDGYEFEHFISNLLIDLGFETMVTKQSNDYGVDVIAKKNQITYAIQCKYYSTTVGNSAVQEIVSGMRHYNAHIGVVATNNYFTRPAHELAKTNNVVMWDRDVLLEMIDNSK